MIIARILAFGIMALGAVWIYTLMLFFGLSGAWLETEFWSALGIPLLIALLGALVALAIVAAALPLAWRSVWLALWSLLAVLVAYGTGFWAYRAIW